MFLLLHEQYKSRIKILNKQILNCELGKYCDSDEMGIIFRKKKETKQSIIKTVTARKKKKQFRGQQQREKFN